MQKMSTLLAAFFAIFFMHQKQKKPSTCVVCGGKRFFNLWPIMKTILSNRLEENEKTM